MKPEISVIIPVYNVKPYLKEAVDSIIQQKEFLHEIIIIDDGSTDGSGDLLDKLYGSSEFIKIIHKENEGQGIARNFGTDISTGNFIYYFDSDDIAIQGLFKKFHELVLSLPDLELFCFSGDSFLDKNYSIDDVTKPKLLSEKAYKRNIKANCSSGEEAYKLLSNNKGFYPGPPLYISKKSILGKNGIKFKANRYEDEEFTIRVFLNAGLTFICNDVYFKRRLRKGSTMQLNRSFKDILGYIQTIESLTGIKEYSDLQDVTKELLSKKISILLRNIITIKASSNLKLSREERKIYKKSLRPFIWGDKDLFIFYYKYPLEYKLRKLKKQIFH